MDKIINSEVVIANLQCTKKAFLLLFTEEKGIFSEYVQILNQQRDAQRIKYIEKLKLRNMLPQTYEVNDMRQGKDVLVNVTLTFDSFEAHCDILSKVDRKSSLGEFSYEPTIFINTRSISKEHRLELLFIGYILSKIQGTFPEQGIIVNIDGASYKVKLKPLLKSLLQIITRLKDWVASPPSQSPPIILNKHCPYCQFQDLCKVKAEQEDNLSLLSGITVKAIKHYEKKGIFTVKQLSYLFKPRRLKKQARNRHKTHKPELQALAIRSGKIYIQEMPSLSRQKVELFVDIEGVPDQQGYYLIGLLVYEEGEITYHSFWADTSQMEAQIWQNFLDKVKQYPTSYIYHYGNYEIKAVDVLSKRYGCVVDDFRNRFVNINTSIYGKIYFPVRSNSLKEIGHFIGASWTHPSASGLQSLVWRYHWEATRNEQYKDFLVTYNKEDCFALKLLVDELSKIKDSANTLSEVDFVSKPKRHSTESGKQVHSQFETILEFAHANYDKRKIKFRQNDEESEKQEKPRGGYKRGFQGQRKVRPKPTKTIQVSPAGVCPKDGESLRTTERISKRLIIDLILTKNGIKKTITEYVGKQGYCKKCARYYAPADIRKYGVNQIYGHGFQAWVVYQRVALRMTYGNIAEALAEQFSEREPKHYIAEFIKNVSRYYEESEEAIIKSLLNSPIIHADETPINVRGATGVTQYVWTFANDRYVVFKLSKTREATIAHEFLASYKGILISDFYSGYDAIQCEQQKCWVHLIRELNDDLWEAPFDTELETFVCNVRNLIIPIMEAVQKYGLKKRHLLKFMKQVEQFYEKVIVGKSYKSELVIKYQKRFIKYRNSLFVFLQHDGVPWHNNTAERALRHVTRQQQISLIFFENVTHDYLRLLGIRQTLRFQGKSFFKFLFSGEKNIDKAK